MNGTTTLDWRAEWRPPAILAALFLALIFLPVGYPRFDRARSWAPDASTEDV